MNILIIGSGGREHALTWAVSQSPTTKKIYVAPGNAGTRDIAENVFIAINDPKNITEFCHGQNIDFVIIGPEAPLADGLVDALTEAGIKTFGPSKAAAQLEASKGFTKRLCDKYNIPTAAYQEFSEADAAKTYVTNQSLPIVIKADGLAAGKGVIIAQTQEEAFLAIDDILGGKFGSAGASLVIEEFLEGEEVSFFALVDGAHAIPFGSAQDHKRVGEGDTGPNTGGMGTYSPAPIFTLALEDQVMQDIVIPTVQGMENEGMPFKGVLFVGLMITANGPKLIEFNVRFGDPETQVLMARLKSDLVPLLLATVEGDIQNKHVDLSDRTALCVVMAANGYPEDYQKGTRINHIEHAENLSDVTVFHAGTKYEDGEYFANGGRVLGITATGSTITDAQKKAYNAVDTIDWKEGFCRRDIGWRAVKRLAS